MNDAAWEKRYKGKFDKHVYCLIKNTHRTERILDLDRINKTVSFEFNTICFLLLTILANIIKLSN